MLSCWRVAGMCFSTWDWAVQRRRRNWSLCSSDCARTTVRNFPLKKWTHCSYPLLKKCMKEGGHYEWWEWNWVMLIPRLVKIRHLVQKLDQLCGICLCFLKNVQHHLKARNPSTLRCSWNSDYTQTHAPEAICYACVMAPLTQFKWCL
jgi:hypothetical protein